MAFIDVENFGVKYPLKFEPVEPVKKAENLPAQTDADTWHDLPVVTASTGNIAVRGSRLLTSPITPVENGLPGPSAYGNLS